MVTKRCHYYHLTLRTLDIFNEDPVPVLNFYEAFSYFHINKRRTLLRYVCVKHHYIVNNYF